MRRIICFCLLSILILQGCTNKQDEINNDDIHVDKINEHEETVSNLEQELNQKSILEEELNSKIEELKGSVRKCS